MSQPKQCPKCQTANPEEANFCRNCGYQFRALKANQSYNGKGLLIFFLVVFLIATGVLTICYIDLNDSYSDLIRIESDYSTFKATVSSHIPMVITSVELGAVDRDFNTQIEYGATLYSTNISYIGPKISYYGINSGSITLQNKIYGPDGKVLHYDDSPDGFTYTSTFTINEGENYYKLAAYGSDSKGASWSPNTYRLEIWYNDICLKSKTFTIY